MKLFAALREDTQQGWVWLQDTSLPARSIVRIKNPTNGNVVYCEALQIDTNFLSVYNKSPRITISTPGSALVINGWYRAALGGLSTKSEVSLDIKPSNCWWGKFKACTDHPQIIVRVAAWLGAIGLFLGVVGVVLGVLSLCPKAYPAFEGNAPKSGAFLNLNVSRNQTCGSQMDIKQYVIGYLVSTLGGAIFLWLLIDKLGWCYVNGKSKTICSKSLSIPLGIVERCLYTTALIIGAKEWVAVWLALKVASTWKHWEKEERNHFNLFLIGTALSVAFGFIGACISIGGIPIFTNK